MKIKLTFLKHFRLALLVLPTADTVGWHSEGRRVNQTPDSAAGQFRVRVERAHISRRGSGQDSLGCESGG